MGMPGAGAWRRRVGGRDARSNSIASDARARAGMRASSRAPGTGRPSASRAPVPFGPARTTMSGCSVTRPMTATGRSHRSQIARTASQRAGSTIATIRSWDSEIITSNGSRPGSRRGIASRSTSIPVPPRSAVSHVAQVIPAAPRSWTETTTPFGDQLQRRLDQQLLGERIADLDRRTLGSILVRERRTGQHRCATDPIAAGGGSIEDDEVARSVRGSPHEHPVLEQPDRHHVDQRVALVGRVEHELAADGRDAHAVAVPADAAHDTVHQVPGPRVSRVAEP